MSHAKMIVCLQSIKPFAVQKDEMSIIFKDRHPVADCLEESGQISDWLNIQSA